MIAYFDTSALVPLVISEGGTRIARQMWLTAERRVSTRLARVEARAALAQAQRLGRLSTSESRAAKRLLEGVIDQLDLAEVDDPLVRQAADLAERLGLRAYDAVHLATALRVSDPDVVLVAGDSAVIRAAVSTGLAVASIA